MNKIKRMYIIWGMLVIGIFIILTIFMYKNKTSAYKELEKQLAEASKKYVEVKFSYPNSGESVKVTIEQLKAMNLIEELKINDETCNGYAIISRPSTVFEYKGYVTCQNYTTKGYEK